jgi:hypothetical protein
MTTLFIVTSSRRASRGVLARWYSTCVRERLADRPPRPLADAPTRQLSARVDELTRDWLIELVAQLELTDVGSFELEALAADGPSLCDSVIAALAADDALADLQAAGRRAEQARRTCVAAARGRTDQIPAVVESLRRVIWSHARSALYARAPAELVAALADRLAHVCSTVASTAIATSRDAEAAHGSAGEASDSAVAEPLGPPADDVRADIPPPLESPDDVRADIPGPLESPADDVRADIPAALEGQLEFIVRDARGRAKGPARRDWQDELREALASEPASSLLLVDLDGHERVLAADGRAALQRAERALVRSLVDDATLVAERLGRYWVVSGCGSGADATEFARRLGEAVAAEPGHHGTSLKASIGFTLVEQPIGAELTEREGGFEELCGRVEEAMLSARAAGAGVDSR